MRWRTGWLVDKAQSRLHSVVAVLNAVLRGSSQFGHPSWRWPLLDRMQRHSQWAVAHCGCGGQGVASPCGCCCCCTSTKMATIKWTSRAMPAAAFCRMRLCCVATHPTRLRWGNAKRARPHACAGPRRAAAALPPRRNNHGTSACGVWRVNPQHNRPALVFVIAIANNYIPYWH